MRVGVTEFQPLRLAQIRERVGVTKTNIASALGVSPATLSKWESGQQLPTLEKLHALSLFFGVKDRFFLKPLPHSSESPAFYRSMANATKLARQTARVKLDWVAEISKYLEAWVDWPQLKLPNVQFESFLSIDNHDIELLAAETRNVMGLGRGPVKDVLLALEGSGILCAADELGFANMDGVSLWSDLTNRPYVFIGRDKANPIRNRFDAAHELGHVIMHQHVDASTFKKYHKEIERQADYFAGAFLLPAESFSSDIGIPSLDSFLTIKRRWKVSVAAMIMRSYQLGIIDDYDKMRLFKGRSARGWSKGEPLDSDFTFESPKLLSRAFQMLNENNLVSKTEALYAIGLPAKEVESLSGLPRGYFSVSDPESGPSPTIKSSSESNVYSISSHS
jgi:Zn-dependent peptidase ImmA (M78 family)/DNA-binding XRE family transcriptional regulator